MRPAITAKEPSPYCKQAVSRRFFVPRRDLERGFGRESIMDLNAWDERDRTTETEATPAPLLIRTASGLTAGSALDLACGTGRNALWLAGRGWEVTAVDGSAVAID